MNAPPPAFAITPQSRFDAALFEQHMREAAEYARLCQQHGEPLLDPCGPRGDLYFLLKACRERAEQQSA